MGFANMDRFRYRVKHQKMAPFHLISQLDLSRLWSRAFRRAELPVAYSQGFNPRPLLSFGPALPLGVESRAEYWDVSLSRELSPQELLDALNKEVFSELKIEEVNPIPLSFPSINQSIKGVRYSYYFSPSVKKIASPLPTEEGIEKEKEEMVGEFLVVLFLFKKEKILYSAGEWAKVLEEKWSEDPARIVKEEVLW
ncbi:MAG: TIGR03936 family radical SAM-associated protein [Candidatus Atribacteria bacterium]|nr:TIGR03936 family radical SAM-associated protein [Candidatus Atribacteria bacterium]